MIKDEISYVVRNKIMLRFLYVKKFLFYFRVSWGVIEKCKVWE